MAVTITKLGNQAKVDLSLPEKKYYDCLAMAQSFSLNTNATPYTVSSRTIEQWDNSTPLSDITIIGSTTHSGMATVNDWNDALTDLSTLTT